MKCLRCGKEQHRTKKYSRRQWAARRYCSRICKARHNGRPRAFRHWKGGITITSGYRCVYRPDHPAASSKGYVMEHRLVMESAVGRYLRPNEHVHHRNHIRDDNRIENLELINGEEHNRRHALEMGLGRDKKDYRLRDSLGRFGGLAKAS